jgi:hypothetical protein
VFGEGEVAYQIGETAEILSRGYLCATPHSVQVLFIFDLYNGNNLGLTLRIACCVLH